jgi:hypothetical protein
VSGGVNSERKCCNSFEKLYCYHETEVKCYGDIDICEDRGKAVDTGIEQVCLPTRDHDNTVYQWNVSKNYKLSSTIPWIC